MIRYEYRTKTINIFARFLSLVSMFAVLSLPSPVIGDTHTLSHKQKTLSVLFWGSAVDKPIMDFFHSACRTFEKENPGISVTVDFYSVEQYKTKLPLLMAMNTPPDIFMTWPGAFLETYVKAGKVIPLDDALNADQPWRDSFETNAFDSLRYNGKIYAIPTSMAVAVLYYNKQIFNRFGLKPPLTYDDMIQSITVFRNEGITPMAFGNKEPWVGGMLAGQIMQRIGGRTLLSDLKSGIIPWTHPSFRKAADTILELRQKQAFPEGFNDMDYQSMITMFSEGKAAMMLMGTWYFQNLFNDCHLPVDTVGALPFPVLDGQPDSGAVWMGQTDMNIAISTQCRDKQVAVAFLASVSSLSSQAELLNKTGAIPVTRIDMETLPSRPELLSLMKQLRAMKGMFLFPDIQLGGVQGQEFNTSIKTILSGESPDTVFKQLELSFHSGQ